MTAMVLTMRPTKESAAGTNLPKKSSAAAGMDNVSVTPVKSGEFPVKAKRPKNSRMSKEKLVTNGFSLLPAWQDAVARYIKELNLL